MAGGDLVQQCRGWCGQICIVPLVSAQHKTGGNVRKDQVQNGSRPSKKKKKDKFFGRFGPLREGRTYRHATTSI